MELIDRKKAIYYISNYMREGGFMELSDFDIASLLLEVPTIESRPKGEWIDCSEEGYVECPFCHHLTNCDDNIEELHFCWNCGAKLGADMRGKRRSLKMISKQKKHLNILPFVRRGEKDVKKYSFTCRGCTISDRGNRWESYISSVANELNQSIDNSYLILEEEPKNKYDPNAIKIVSKGEIFGLLGYVGKEYTANVKKILAGSSLYRIDIEDEDECGEREMSLVISYLEK